MLPISQEASSQATNKIKTLVIAPTNIAPQFASQQFTYRVSDENYLTDYYNIFFTSQNKQVQQMLINRLSFAKLNAYVTNGDTLLTPNYVLYSDILAFYADYRHPNTPFSKVSIEFKLYKSTESGYHLVFDKTFESHTPLEEKTSEALMIGWGADIQNINSQLIQALRANGL